MSAGLLDASQAHLSPRDDLLKAVKRRSHSQDNPHQNHHHLPANKQQSWRRQTMTTLLSKSALSAILPTPLLVPFSEAGDEDGRDGRCRAECRGRRLNHNGSCEMLRSDETSIGCQEHERGRVFIASGAEFFPSDSQTVSLFTLLPTFLAVHNHHDDSSGRIVCLINVTSLS